MSKVSQISTNKTASPAMGMGKPQLGSITLKNPVYLATLSEDKLRSVISHGVPGHNMPAFSKGNGGSLSQEQIDTLVKGLIAWRDASNFPLFPCLLTASRLAMSPPVKLLSLQSCASCHGADGTGAKAAQLSTVTTESRQRPIPSHGHYRRSSATRLPRLRQRIRACH
jgi:mono/diheme cytochrome c family protein